MLELLLNENITTKKSLKHTFRCGPKATRTTAF